MKKLLVLSILSAFSLSVVGCQNAAPVKDGVCTQLAPGGLPAPIDPDCNSTNSK